MLKGNNDILICSKSEVVGYHTRSILLGRTISTRNDTQYGRAHFYLVVIISPLLQTAEVPCPSVAFLSCNLQVTTNRPVDVTIVFSASFGAVLNLKSR